MLKYKNQSGFISVYVLGIMLFFLFITIGIYNITSKRYKVQLETIEKAVEIYSQNSV